MKKLELLSPARNKDIAIEAIKHGADAVYIGAPNFGARKMASNSLDDIAEVIDFAHKFSAKVYITLNTIIYNNEIKKFEILSRDLYRIGADAFIVQDMGILRMKLPPIALHASTQCDIRTPEKALFLEQMGFSQIVLARELSLSQIRDITTAVKIPVECFIHGALCVSYSGKCHSSFVKTGRSANRGECSQICRLPFSIYDSKGTRIATPAHYLSLKDLNQTENIDLLIEAGVSSFKIEGRLKDIDYVKNITAHYNLKLNEFIEKKSDEYCRSSYGHVKLNFSPKTDKSFNRGFTDYFIKGINQEKISNPLSPKSMGEIIPNIKTLNNGDGISFIRNGEYIGDNIIRIEGDKIKTSKSLTIPKGEIIHRTNDIQWQKLMKKETSERKIGVSVFLTRNYLHASDERGNKIFLPLFIKDEKSEKKQSFREEFSKLGTTIYFLKDFISKIDPYHFIPRSYLSQLRRQMVVLLDASNKINYKYEYRKEENYSFIYPDNFLSFRENVSNKLAEKFYYEHGVTKIDQSLESAGKNYNKDMVLMTTKHCVLRELGLCKKKLSYPLYLDNGKIRLRLQFDCKNCEMQVLNA